MSQCTCDSKMSTWMHYWYLKYNLQMLSTEDSKVPYVIESYARDIEDCQTQHQIYFLSFWKVKNKNRKIIHH